MNYILYLKIFAVTADAFVFLLLSLMWLDPSVVGMQVVLLKCATLWTGIFRHLPSVESLLFLPKKVLYKEN